MGKNSNWYQYKRVKKANKELKIMSKQNHTMLQSVISPTNAAKDIKHHEKFYKRKMYG